MAFFLEQYTVDFISNRMKLRKPQEKSLQILERIVNAVGLKKGMNLSAALDSVHKMYATCKDFEREFLSLTFALATGVGKTRLMGAFIAYLYAQHNVKNFFVVAPNTTIYEKLRRELNDPTNPKYVFRGLGCFLSAPEVFSENTYEDKNIEIAESDVRIFVYNIDKFNKEAGRMRRRNENLNNSFFAYLSALPDLVMIMDESHHYRADRASTALNDLHPLLGLELTATPLASVKGKQVPFKNVVYEYPLSAAIEDGYTRTPYALTRANLAPYNFGDAAMDRLMLSDGILSHERTKKRLADYARETGKDLIKPFMMVVCQNTEHAKEVEGYIKSEAFRNGAYRNKTIVIHSKQKGTESEENTRLLLEVERADSPVEIVIHVNMLKEGWDVNNLYTIVPLRTAASQILREQMVGRGLRLPYGERTGDKDVDAVVLTAHDNFTQLLEAAQRGDSIFKAGNVINADDAEDEPPEAEAQLSIQMEADKLLEEAYARTNLPKSEAMDTLFRKSAESIGEKVSSEIQNSPEHTVTPRSAEKIVQETKGEISADRDLGEIFRDNEMPLTAWMRHHEERTHRAAMEKFIPIPQITVTEQGPEKFIFLDFDLDLSAFPHTPIHNDLLIQNLDDLEDRRMIRGGMIDFDAYNPKQTLVRLLRQKPEIDYMSCSELLFKLISQVCDHYEDRYGENGMKNVIMMYKRDIADKIYDQMLRGHCVYEQGFIQEEVGGVRSYNLQPRYNSFQEQVNLYERYSGPIRSVLFTGIRKGVFDKAMFDSDPELRFARLAEQDGDILNWLRPASQEFNVTYRDSLQHSHHYRPDFVVETDKIIYLTEVKAKEKMEDTDVQAKKERGLQYCEMASRWGSANGYKEWRYLFIPDNQIQQNVTFEWLAAQYSA